MTSRSFLPWLALIVAASLQGGCTPREPVRTGAAAAAKTTVRPDDLVMVSGAVSPSVGYELQRRDGALVLVVSAASYEPAGTGVSVSAGASADRTVMLADSQARTVRADGRARFEFAVPAG